MKKLLATFFLPPFFCLVLVMSTEKYILKMIFGSTSCYSNRRRPISIQKKLSAEVEKLLPSKLDFNTVIITGACGQIDDFRSGILYYKYFRKGRGLFFWKEYPIEYTVTVNINSLEASVVSLEQNEYYTPPNLHVYRMIKNLMIQ